MSDDAISILIADDDENIREIVESYLDKLGYLTTAVGDGRQALDKFGKLSFDICVLDIHMPGLNGLELVGEIRKLKPDSRILFITGEANEDEIKRVYADQLGVAVMRKPFKLDVLRNYVELLASHIGQARQSEGEAEAHRKFWESQPWHRRLRLRARSLALWLHRSLILYVILASLVISLALVGFLDLFGYLNDSVFGKLRSVDTRLNQILDEFSQWHKEDTRQNGR